MILHNDFEYFLYGFASIIEKQDEFKTIEEALF